MSSRVPARTRTRERKSAIGAPCRASFISMTVSRPTADDRPRHVAERRTGRAPNLLTFESFRRRQPADDRWAASRPGRLHATAKSDSDWRYAYFARAAAALAASA